MKQNDKSYYIKLRSQIEEEHPFFNNSEIAYELIFHEIAAGALAPGDKLQQENLAAVMDMSRTPVREAMQRLEQEMYLERTGGGYQIRRPQIGEYVQFHEFRLTLEPRAAYFAARNITGEQLVQLKQNLEETKAAIQEDKKYHVAMMDTAFHEIIAEASGNVYIRDAIVQYQNKRMYNLNIALDATNFRQLYNKHRKIYEAIYNSDETAAESAMRSHLQFYIKNIDNA